MISRISKNYGLGPSNAFNHFKLNRKFPVKIQISMFRPSPTYFANKDYYKILGVPKSAEKAEIKKKYFELVHKKFF
jgi:DnaJ-domain-containing protein 1